MHAIVTQPDNLKRFIIGRQFMTVLTGFMLAEVFTFAYWDKGDYNATAFWIIVQSGTLKSVHLSYPTTSLASHIIPILISTPKHVYF